MSKWANNDAIVIAEDLANVAYQYYVFDDKSEAFEYYDLIACGTHPESTGCIYNDVKYEYDYITDFAEEHQLKLDEKSMRLLYEALDLASAYDGPVARGLEA